MRVFWLLDMRALPLLVALFPSIACSEPLTVTATATLASEYVYRGVSQSDNEIAPQGMLQASKNGWYTGTWASKVDYNDGVSKYEWDVYAGKAWQSGPWDIDAHVLHYDFPGVKSSWQYGTWRAGLGVGHKVGNGRVGVYTDRYDSHFGSGHSHYMEINGSYPLGDYVVSGKLGRQRFADNLRMRLPDFNYARIALSRVWNGYNLSAGFDRSNIQQRECFGGKDWCGSHLNFQVSKSFTLMRLH